MPLTERTLYVTIPRARRLPGLRLFVLAIATRIRLIEHRCCYCGTIAPTRWPWQAGSAHLAACTGD